MDRILSSEEIGFRVRTLRQKAGWSQEQLSEMIGVSPQQLQKYETGKNMMNTDKLQQVAQALSIPVQALFTDINDHMPIGVSEQILLDSYRAIPNKRLQENILEILVNISSKQGSTPATYEPKHGMRAVSTPTALPESHSE
jgi:transcriptional regulator with XRE-family HTH domain